MRKPPFPRGRAVQILLCEEKGGVKFDRKRTGWQKMVSSVRFLGGGRGFRRIGAFFLANIRAVVVGSLFVIFGFDLTPFDITG